MVRLHGEELRDKHRELIHCGTYTDGAHVYQVSLDEDKLTAKYSNFDKGVVIESLVVNRSFDSETVTASSLERVSIGEFAYVVRRVRDAK
tara:strand:+ start:1168 stop:1437 length:270 start_codon:yes stop_codon:yes gene_type:complete